MTYPSLDKQNNHNKEHLQAKKNKEADLKTYPSLDKNSLSLLSLPIRPSSLYFHPAGMICNGKMIKQQQQQQQQQREIKNAT